MVCLYPTHPARKVFGDTPSPPREGTPPGVPRKWLAGGLVFLMLLLAACRGAVPQQPATEAVALPTIEPIVLRRILPGDRLVLRGQNLGLDQGQATLGERPLRVVDWGEAKVAVRLPLDVGPGEATLTLKTAAGTAQVNLRIADPRIAERVNEISCGDGRFCSVYLPPAYDTDADRRFPVIYHFQRDGTSNRGVMDSADLAPIAEPYGFIMVFDWQIMDDAVPLLLVREIDEAYRTIPRPEARGMWLSSASGGRGLRIASEHPEVFSAVDASAACVGAFDPEKARQLRIRLDIGDHDTTCGNATLRAHEQLQQAGVLHIYDIFAGDHTRQVVFSEPVIRSVLDFFRSALAGA